MWQVRRFQWTGDVPPLLRLIRAGKWGLPITDNNRLNGGIKERTAYDFIVDGLAYSALSPDGLSIRLYPRQLQFSFMERPFQ